MTTPRDIASDLEAIASADDFSARSADLVRSWTNDGVGAEAIGSILRFMEGHAGIDFGMPGALVHFAERFHRNGYEQQLLASIGRRPTPMTVWMLNRVINGARNAEQARLLVSALERARSHPAADDSTIQMANRFLERLVK